MTRVNGRLKVWLALAATSGALLLAGAAPAAHAVPKRTCSPWVELKWPNGTGTGVWVRECTA